MPVTGGADASTRNGVLIVDKPSRMTSHDVVAAVRRALGGEPRRRGHRNLKVGHAGTLDPGATGVLVVCIGKATRLVPYLQASRKTYDARVQLGIRTTTLDADGDVVEQQDTSAVDEAALCDALRTFVGEIRQVPPMVSAVRVGGERLYAKARRGEEVERGARPVTIHDIVLEHFSPGPRAWADLLVTCSPGTYVRSLAADVGDRLAVGGHLARLRRLASGRFTLEEAVSYGELRRLADEGRLGEHLLSMADAVADYPSVTAAPGDAAALGYGQPLAATGLEGPVAVLSADGDLLAMVEDREGAARPLAVFTRPRADR